MFLPYIFVRRYGDCDGGEQGERQVRHTVWHHPNAYYHVNGEPGDDNGESISAIQIAGLWRRSTETRRDILEENKGEKEEGGGERIRERERGERGREERERRRLFSYDSNRAWWGAHSKARFNIDNE